MKTAEQILDEHCTTIYNRDEEIKSSKSAVVIAMEEFAKEYHTEQLNIGNIRLSCPECGSHYIIYTEHEYYECNSCDKTWIMGNKA